MRRTNVFESTLFGFFSLALILTLMVPPTFSYDFSIYKHVTGPQNVFVITVQFPDKPASTQISDIQNRVFTEMDRYYRNVSYGKITLTGDISESWILLPHNMSYYGDYDGRNDHSSGARALIDDAIKEIDPLKDFRGFNCVLVVHAGEDEAYSQEVTDIWSWGYWEGLSATTSDGITFDQGAVVSEFNSLGCFCHEFGHIIGLPDLYNYDFNSSQRFVENWGLMGYGCQNGNPPGSKPAHILSWGKMFLGWINSSEVIEITHRQPLNVTLEPLETLSTGTKVVKIRVAPKFFYLVEVRADNNLPDTGVLIAFINETKGSGGGIVKVVDSNLSTTSLNDAIFHVGEIFEETKHHFTIKVFEHLENSSYTIQISNKLMPYIDISMPTTIEAFQDLQIRVKATNYNGTPLQGLVTELYINGQKYQTLMTDINGTATFVANFDLFMVGKKSIKVYISGGEDYIDHQIERIIEVIFPRTYKNEVVKTILGASLTLMAMLMALIGFLLAQYLKPGPSYEYKPYGYLVGLVMLILTLGTITSVFSLIYLLGIVEISFHMIVGLFLSLILALLVGVLIIVIKIIREKE